MRQATVSSAQSPPAWTAALVGAAMVALFAWLRLGALRDMVLPIGFGVPIVIVAWFRAKRVLWATTIAFAIIAAVKFFHLLPSERGKPIEYDVVSGIVLIGDLIIVSLIGHFWINANESLHRQNAQLESANNELVAREEEIARQNEELQSQTEELERQSEELRVTNDELAHRERTLQTLLSLSRTLATQLSADETMNRICETLGDLVNGPTAASAILVQEGDQLVVRCHHGFGPEGVENVSIPSAQSFAALVLSRGRTGYIEDVALRPDLQFPRPKEGPGFSSVLAAPLRVGGEPIGTLEVYGRDKRTWTDEQISLVESLAAQTSVSLEAAHLFETVSRERQRFETMLRTVPIGIAVASADGTDVRVNPAGAAILNVPPDANIAADATAGAWKEFIDGRQLPPTEYPIARAARGAEIIAQEIELVLPSNKRLVALVNGRPIRDREGRITGAVTAFADITPQKELQRELDLRRREAEEASVRKTRFLAAVSHDIRTPANAISLLAELVRRTAANPSLASEIPELARELHGSAVSLVNLLSDVLDVARFDSDKIELQESEFSLGELLEEEKRQMLPLARDKRIELDIPLMAEPIWLRTDRIKLARILGNLIGNAIKFTDQGSVRVEAARVDENGIELRVSDTGIGIAPEYMRHIFDEFFQLRNPERDRNKGTGLGLTICKRLVDAMGGQISVQSTIGSGSTFTVSLPATSVLYGRR